MSKGGPFDSVRVTQPRRNYFDLSCVRLYTCGFSDLIPVFCQEVLPGDKMRIGNEYVVRMQPLVAPVLSEITFFTEYFFVPNRLLWSDWEDFITAGKDGTLDPVFPTLDLNDSGSDHVAFKTGSLFDYFGLPCGQYTGSSASDGGDYWFSSSFVPTTMLGNWLSKDVLQKINVLPFRAYLKIWNYFYRDENLEDDLDDMQSHPPINERSELYYFYLRQRSWHKDYFSAALPWPQRGVAPAISFDPTFDSHSILIGLTPQVVSAGITYESSIRQNQGGFYFNTDHTGAYPLPNNYAYLGGYDSSGKSRLFGIKYFQGQDAHLSPFGFDATDLRLLMQTQLFLERSARFGSRLNEFLLAHFGVSPSDKTLQEPEYIGGSRSSIVVSEVLQTSATESGGSPLGTQGGRGLGVTINHIGTYTASEHGFIIGLASIQPPRRQYEAQGIGKMWTRSSRYDYYFPEFANLTEQPVYTHELFSRSDYSYDTIFGYMPIYSEYRSNQDLALGQMRHFSDSSLDFWTTSTYFTGSPFLNDVFIRPDKSQLNRIFQVQDEDGFIVHFRNSVHAWRPVVPSGLPLSLVRF